MHQIGFQLKSNVKGFVKGKRNALEATRNETFKIAFVSLTYPPSIGGVETQLAELSRELSKRGFEVHVVTQGSPGIPGFEQAGSLFVHRLIARGPRIIAKSTFIVRSIICLYKIRPRLVHSHEIFLPTTTSAIYKFLTHTPIITTVHSSGLGFGEVAGLKRSRLGLLRQYWLSSQISYFIAISRTVEKELRTIGISESKLVSIPNGIDMERFIPSSETERVALRRQLGLPKGFIVIYVGRLVGPKRVDNLINIWTNIRKVNPEAILLVVGTGPDEEALRRSAGPGIIFAGVTHNVAPYLRAANLFVLPSMSEGFSLCTLEALACGLPVIATRVGAVPELIHHGQNGWIVEVDNLADLENSLLKLIGNPNLCACLGLAGRRSVERDYSISTTTSKLIDLYALAARQKSESARKA